MIGCIMRTRNDAQTRTLCGRAAEPSEFVFEDRKHALLYAGPARPMRLTACTKCVEASIAIDLAEAQPR
jgi:hypothetical protein